MRNLKRALSLTLASVMLLGMMVVGTSAAGYDDVKDTDNVEAIEVLQEIEVMVGDDRGFGPERPVNRAEMAVVMGKLLNLDYNYYASSCPFNDVYDWARGYVGACYANKIVSGRGDGVYDPGATVTAVEAASMLMRALGYFQYANDVADGFELSTVRQGTIIGIFDGVGSSATAPMTRNQVAQMVLNTLRTGVVEPDGNTINLTTPDGSVFTGKVNYVNVTSNKPFARAISTVGATSVGSYNDGSIVELGERLYDGKLKLDDYKQDAFGRPARRWEYDGKEIGTYVKKELLRQEWTTKVTGRDLYDVLTKTTIDTYTPYITIDGETTEGVLNAAGQDANAYFTSGNLVRTNTEAVGRTGDGVKTEVYVDTDRNHEAYYIAIINTYLAKATEDYNTKTEDVDMDVYALRQLSNGELVKNLTRPAANPTNITPLTPEIEDFPELEEVKEDDLFLVHVAEGEIKEIIKPEILADSTLTAFKVNSYAEADGTRYDYANTARYDPEVLDRYTSVTGKVNLKDLSYNVVLDEYGYLIGIELNEDPNQYVFITGIDGNASNLKNKEADMAAIFTDGTMKVITVNMVDSEDIDTFLELGPIVNTWCTYTVDKDGTYTLKAVPARMETGVKAAQWAQNAAHSTYQNSGSATANSYTIDKGHVALFGNTAALTGVPASLTRVYGNDDTVYINVSLSVINGNKTYTAKSDAAGKNGLTDGIGDETNDANYVRGTVTDATAKRVAIIDDVDSVTVGVKNTNIVVTDLTEAGVETLCDTGDTTANNLAYPKSEIYTLYGSDGYVIAAVTIGEDSGTSAKYAYFHTGDATRESYSSSDEEWTWSREAIIDGEKVTLTEKGSTLRKLGRGNVKAGDWAEVRYDSNGNVRKVTNLSNIITASGSTYGEPGGSTQFRNESSQSGSSYASQYILDVESVEKTTEKHDTVLLWANYTDEAGSGSKGKAVLTFENGTLYTDAAKTEGISVSPDVKVVVALAKPVNNLAANIGALERVDQFDKTTDGYTGYKGLENALRDLDSDPASFDGYLCAVLEGDVATSIILNDTRGERVNTGVTTPGGPSSSYSFATLNESALNIGVTWTDTDWQTPIREELESEGYAVTSWPVSVGTGSVGAYKNGVPYSFSTYRVNHYVTIKLNTVDTPVLDTTTLANLAALDATCGGAGTHKADIYVKAKVNGAAETYVASTNTTPLVTNDTVDTTPYLKIASTPNVATLAGLTDGSNAAATATVSYKIAGATVAANYTTPAKYVKLNDTIEITVDFGAGNKLTVKAAGDAKLSAGTADDTTSDYVADIATAATLGASATAETKANNTITFPYGTGTYTAGKYTFTKTIAAADFSTPASGGIVVATVALGNT